MARDEKEVKLLKRWKLRKPIVIITEKKKTQIHSKKIENKKFSSFEVLTYLCITSIIGVLIGISINKGDTTPKYSDALNNFINDYNNVIDDYYDKVDEKKVLKKAFEAVVNEIDDPYSSVVDETLSNSLSTQLNGSYSGFGIEIANLKDGNIMITGIIDNSPALKADLRAGDVILKMNGKSVEGVSTTDFSATVKASNKENMTLTVLRGGQNLDISIKREIVTLKSVSSEIIEKNEKKIGYIYISLFAANTDVQFQAELEKLEKAKIDSLIIDVRENSGGHLTAVENIVSNFLDSTNVIYQIKNKEKTTKTYSKGKKTKKYKIVVLVNKNSASASELLAASLQESYNATLVGTKTFGKGTVQTVLNSENTDVEYKLTTSKWLTPKGNWIHKKGIKPNINVELDKKFYESPTNENDNQLQTAINELLK